MTAFSAAASNLTATPSEAEQHIQKELHAARQRRAFGILFPATSMWPDDKFDALMSQVSAPRMVTTGQGKILCEMDIAGDPAMTLVVSREARTATIVTPKDVRISNRLKERIQELTDYQVGQANYRLTLDKNAKNGKAPYDDIAASGEQGIAFPESSTGQYLLEDLLSYYRAKEKEYFPGMGKVVTDINAHICRKVVEELEGLQKREKNRGNAAAVIALIGKGQPIGLASYARVVDCLSAMRTGMQPMDPEMAHVEAGIRDKYANLAAANEGEPSEPTEPARAEMPNVVATEEPQSEQRPEIVESALNAFKEKWGNRLHSCREFAAAGLGACRRKLGSAWENLKQPVRIRPWVATTALLLVCVALPQNLYTEQNGATTQPTFMTQSNNSSPERAAEQQGGPVLPSAENTAQSPGVTGETFATLPVAVEQAQIVPEEGQTPSAPTKEITISKPITPVVEAQPMPPEPVVATTGSTPETATTSEPAQSVPPITQAETPAPQPTESALDLVAIAHSPQLAGKLPQWVKNNAGSGEPRKIVSFCNEAVHYLAQLEGSENRDLALKVAKFGADLAKANGITTPSGALAQTNYDYLKKISLNQPTQPVAPNPSQSAQHRLG